MLRGLGPAGYVRVLQQFEAGAGDYTRERADWAEKPTADMLHSELSKQR